MVNGKEFDNIEVASDYSVKSFVAYIVNENLKRNKRLDKVYINNDNDLVLSIINGDTRVKKNLFTLILATSATCLIRLYLRKLNTCCGFIQ